MALREGEVEWTYYEFLGAARKAMDLFAAHGVIAGDRVVIVARTVSRRWPPFSARVCSGLATLLNARASAREIDAIQSHAEPRIVA